MRTFCIGRWLAWTALAMLTACQQGADSVAAQADKAMQGDGATASQDWPPSLRVMGDGYPRSGDACRRIGESAATVNFLDDSADLVGCHSAAEAAKLGGKILGVHAGITLVSVPARGAVPGGASADARVRGTEYNATAEIRCSGYRKHPAGRCPAGVKRNTEGGLTVIEITWPAGDSRALTFDAAGQLVSADTSQADGSAAFQPRADRQGDMIVVTIGPERYEFAEVFVTGD